MKSKYCLFAGCESGKEKFGIIDQLYEQPFASKEFSWTVLSEFKDVQFNFMFGSNLTIWKKMNFHASF